MRKGIAALLVGVQGIVALSVGAQGIAALSVGMQGIATLSVDAQGITALTRVAHSYILGLGKSWCTDFGPEQVVKFALRILHSLHYYIH